MSDRVMELMGIEEALLEQINNLQDILIVCESPTMQRLIEETMDNLQDECLAITGELMRLQGITEW